MVDLIEDKNTKAFRQNVTKVAIFQTSNIIIEELNRLNKRGLRSLASYIPEDGSLEVDVHSLNIQFLRSDFLDKLDRLNCGYIENKESLSALISLYILQETDLDLDFKDCPNPELVRKLTSQNFRYNPMDRQNPTDNGGFHLNTHNSIFVSFIPIEFEDKLERNIRRELQRNTDLKSETDLEDYLAKFPEKDNEIWLRHKRDGYASENYLENIIHEYVHLLYGRINTGRPPQWLDEGFAWFVGREIGLDLGADYNLDTALDEYPDKERIRWSINFFRDRYYEEETRTLLGWTQEVMLDLEKEAEEGHSQAFLKAILPETLSKRIEKVNEIFSEEIMDSHQDFSQAFNDLENYIQRIERNYEIDRQRADDNMDELAPYFKSYKIVISRLNQIESDLELSKEDVERLNPKKLKIKLTSSVLKKAGKEKMSLDEVENEFERRLQNEVVQFIKTHEKLKRTDRDILDRNISPENLSERFRKKLMAK